MSVNDIVLSAAGAAGTTSATYVEDVFSTYLYKGNGGSQVINNGIELGSAQVQPVGLFTSNNALTLDDDAAFKPGSGEDFTVECWINQTANNSNQAIFFKGNSLGASSGNIGIVSSSTGEWNVWFNSSVRIYGTNTPVTNQWVHIALTRSSSSSLKLFVDGVNVGTGSWSGAVTSTNPFSIGALDNTGFQYQFQGRISNFRFIKGTALYTADFTPPTTELTAVSGTSLLTLKTSALFTDSSSAARTITNDGVTSSSVVSPFPLTGAGKGGLVWEKPRTSATNHFLWDSVRGTNKLSSNLTDAQVNNGIYAPTFTSTGYTSNYGWSSAQSLASWTFRKQPKFFDVVTFTNTNNTNQRVSHSLGSVPGMIFIKCTDTSESWPVYHQSLGRSKLLVLDRTDAQISVTNYWGTSDSTSTDFGIDSTNLTGTNYVAYLWASNAGGFGTSGTDNVISCGSFTTDGSGNATVNLGYEPQYILCKYTSTSPWYVFDTMRGLSLTEQRALFPNQSYAESGYSGTGLFPTATGFSTLGTSLFDPNATLIYMAIRRPMKVPTDATTVFKPVIATPSGATTITTNFASDLLITTEREKSSITGVYVADRLRGTSQTAFKRLATNQTGAEANVTSGGFGMDSNTTVVDNYLNPVFGVGTSSIYWNFARRPGFLDVVCYTGQGTYEATNHNLGVKPELVIYKRRDASAGWEVVVPVDSVSYYNGVLNTSDALTYNSNDAFIASQYTSTQFCRYADSGTIVSYLFATCPGVSKVGSYTGNGSSQTINCGFTAGARFVLIKRTDSGGDWMVFDTARGIVASSDPVIPINNTVAEGTGWDHIDPNSSGFVINQNSNSNLNVSSATYIYLAIA